MSTEPHRVIYLQWGNHADWDSMTWCQDRVDDDDVAYIRRDIFYTLELEAELYREELGEVKTENYQLRAELTSKQKTLEETATIAFKASTKYQRRIVELESELAAIKPDWKDVLKWVKWRARDKDGRLWNYSNEPSKIGDWGWTQEGGMSDMASGCQNWRNTLERRPEET